MRTYVKKDHKYWSMKKINKHSMVFWYTIICLMTMLVVYGAIKASLKATTLISPLVIGPVAKPVYASEPEYKVSCENPKGYLECQAHQGKITWKQYDRFVKIIQCESGWNPDAVNTKNKNGSYDMGLLQINSIHKNISNADKLNYKKAIDWAIAKVKKDGGFGAWSCNRLVK